MRNFLIAAIMLTAAAFSLAQEKAISVPSDTKATYVMLEIGGKWPERTIVTKRMGSSGTSYSKRLYDCSNATFKYLGTGETMAEMANSKPDSKMSPIVSGSIADYVGRQACIR